MKPTNTNLLMNNWKLNLCWMNLRTNSNYIQMRTAAMMKAVNTGMDLYSMAISVKMEVMVAKVVN